MAAATTATTIGTHSGEVSNSNAAHSNEVGRQEIRAAITKAVELRALHAALMQGNSPPAIANLRFPSLAASPIIPRPLSQLSAQDYPVFTPVSVIFFLIFFKFFELKLH